MIRTYVMKELIYELQRHILKPIKTPIVELSVKLSIKEIFFQKAPSLIFD